MLDATNCLLDGGEQKQKLESGSGTKDRTWGSKHRAAGNKTRQKSKNWDIAKNVWRAAAAKRVGGQAIKTKKIRLKNHLPDSKKDAEQHAKSKQKESRINSTVRGKPDRTGDLKTK